MQTIQQHLEQMEPRGRGTGVSTITESMPAGALRGRICLKGYRYCGAVLPEVADILAESLSEWIQNERG